MDTSDTNYVAGSTTSQPTVVEDQDREKSTMRGEKASNKIPLSAYLILGMEFCERFTFYGASLMFPAYMINIFHMKESAVDAVIYGFIFLAYLTPIIGAVIADSWAGKFKTILAFSIVYMCSLGILSGTSAFGTHPVSMVGFGISLVLIGFGTGGIKSNVAPFVADQASELSEHTVERIFRWFYWMINSGGFTGMLLCPLGYKYVGYWLAYLIPSLMFLVALGLFLLGSSRYVKFPPKGSVVLKVFHVMFASIRNKRKMDRERKDLILNDEKSEMPMDQLSDPSLGASFPPKEKKLSFLEAVSMDGDPPKSKRAAASVPSEYRHWLDYAKIDYPEDFVEDMKLTLHSCKIFLVFPFYWCIYQQMQSNFINQGLSMKRPGWVTSEQLNLVDAIAIMILIPIFDQGLYRLLHKRRITFRPIARIVVGFIFATLSMIYSTVLQYFIYHSPPYYYDVNPTKHTFNDISIFWQVPSYFLIAVSEIFSAISGLEFAYSQSPQSMKSIVMSLFLFTNCCGSILNLFIAPVCVDPQMIWVYLSLSISMLVIVILFHLLFRHHKMVHIGQSYKDLDS